VARKKKGEEEQAGFDGQSGQPSRLTPVDIQQKVFRLAFRGYNERDVDEFLDRVTEALAALHEENKRLRELGGGGGGSEDVEAARNQAESIVREAREHAARLMEDAGAPAAAGGGLTSSFLLRERDFLQRMAHSVQEHARWLKDEAKRVQSSGAAVTTAGQKAAKTQKGKAAEGAKKAKTSRTPSVPETANASAGSGEPTAAWGPPQEGMGDSAGGWAPAPQPGEPDPLLSAWESAFTGEGPEPKQGQKTTKEGEPSLKELFWGEE
jgi:DivIVA domain-containing protein